VQSLDDVLGDGEAEAGAGLLAGDEGERGAIAVRAGAVLARNGEALRPREWRGGRCGLLLRGERANEMEEGEAGWSVEWGGVCTVGQP